ncbi:MAG: porin family protein [Rikenellaceae bacterium]
MKKITLVLVSLFVSVSAFAQFGYGARAGMNFSTLVNNGDGIVSEWRVGFAGGVFVDYRFSDLFALELDGLYSQQGVNKFKLRDDDVDYHVRSNVDYITMPLLAKFYLMDGMHFDLGPQVSFQVREKHADNVVAKQLTSDTNKTILDGVIGVGYEFDFGLLLDLRYAMGLTYTYKEADDVRINKNRNSVLQLTAGWRF